MQRIILVGKGAESLEEIASKLSLEYDVPVEIVDIEMSEEFRACLPEDFDVSSMVGRTILLTGSLGPVFSIEDALSELSLEELEFSKMEKPLIIESLEEFEKQDRLDVAHFDLTSHPFKTERKSENIPCLKIPGCLKLMNANIQLEDEESSCEDDEEEDKDN